MKMGMESDRSLSMNSRVTTTTDPERSVLCMIRAVAGALLRQGTVDTT